MAGDNVLSGETTDGGRKLFEGAFGLAGFSKGEIAKAWQAQISGNPALSKYLPELGFKPAATDVPTHPSLHGLDAGLAGNGLHATDPTTMGFWAQFIKFFLDLLSQVPGAEQLLDPSIAGHVAEEYAKKMTL
jgi:hypothetical protein